MMIQSDYIIFFRGVETTNQYIYIWLHKCNIIICPKKYVTYVTHIYIYIRYIIIIINIIYTVMTFKYVEGGPDREAPEVV